MPDIYLWPGATPPEDIILRDPTTAGGATVWTGQASVFGVCVVAATGIQTMVAAASVVGVCVVSAVGVLIVPGTVWTGAASVTGVCVVTAVATSRFAAAAAVVGVCIVNAYSPAPYVPPIVPPGATSGGGPMIFIPRKRPLRVREEELVLA
jgi:hypothetical protein